MVIVTSRFPRAVLTVCEPSSQDARRSWCHVVVDRLGCLVAPSPSAAARCVGRNQVADSESAGSSIAAGELVDMLSFQNVMGDVESLVDLLKSSCELGDYEIVRSMSGAALRRSDLLALERHPAPGLGCTGFYATWWTPSSWSPGGGQVSLCSSITSVSGT